MKLNKKSRAKIFDLHVGLTFDWRETGILRRESAAVGTSRAPWFCFLRIIRACTSMCCAILRCP